jgi:hypothetical protein
MRLILLYDKYNTKSILKSFFKQLNYEEDILSFYSFLEELYDFEILIQKGKHFLMV